MGRLSAQRAWGFWAALLLCGQRNAQSNVPLLEAKEPRSSPLKTPLAVAPTRKPTASSRRWGKTKETPRAPKESSATKKVTSSEGGWQRRHRRSTCSPTANTRARASSGNPMFPDASYRENTVRRRQTPTRHCTTPTVGLTEASQCDHRYRAGVTHGCKSQRRQGL